MPWLSWVGYLAGAGFLVYWGRRARANLSPEGEAVRAGAKRMWVRREYFTEKGWVYHRLALAGGLGIWLLTRILTGLLT
jgi:hypothetical protein